MAGFSEAEWEQVALDLSGTSGSRQRMDHLATAARRRTLAATRDALLPQLISGNLRVGATKATASGAGG